MKRARSSKKPATGTTATPVSEVSADGAASLPANGAEAVATLAIKTKAKGRAKKTTEKMAVTSIFDTPAVPQEPVVNSKRSTRSKSKTSIETAGSTQDTPSTSKSTTSLLSYVKSRASDVAHALLPAKRARGIKKSKAVETINGNGHREATADNDDDDDDDAPLKKKTTRTRSRKNSADKHAKPSGEEEAVLVDEEVKRGGSRRQKTEKAAKTNGNVPAAPRAGWRGRGREAAPETIVENVNEEEEAEDSDAAIEIAGRTKKQAKPSKKTTVATRKLSKAQQEKSKDTQAEVKSEPTVEPMPPKKGRVKKRAPTVDDEDKKRETVIESKEAEEKPGATAAVAASFVTVARGRKRAAPADGEPEQGAAKAGRVEKPLVNNTFTNYVKEDFTLAPGQDQDPNVLRYNLKISSWNVAGLRSWLKKDGLTFLEYEEPDIFCLQEIKCTQDQMPEELTRLKGYHPYWNCNPGGYAGVAIYSKTMPIGVEYGIDDKAFDEHGRIITAEYEKFFLINVYVPNSGRKLVNLEERMRWEKLFQQHVKQLDLRKPVLICGDMNVSHKEIDLANPKSNTKNAGFTIEERDKMTELLGLGFVDTFRLLYPERKDAYTFWSYMGNSRARNIGWRLDYFIVSQRFVNRIVDNCIRAQCKGSDHCPITLFLKL